jgi:hypothetical protein
MSRGVDHSGEYDESDTVGVVCPSWLDLPLQVQRQLLAEEEILGGQASVGPQAERDQAQDIAEESERSADHHGVR